MSLRDFINPSQVYVPDSISRFYRHVPVEPGYVGDTTSVEYMPYFAAFHGMSEMIRSGNLRALVYRLKLYAYSPIYSRRQRNVARDFSGSTLQILSTGGSNYNICGDIACSIQPGAVIQICYFTGNDRTMETKTLLMVGIKPEAVFNASILKVRPEDFALFVNLDLITDPKYANFYKKLYPAYIQPLMKEGIRTLFVRNPKDELFRTRSMSMQFSSVAQLREYKQSLNRAIFEDPITDNIYRYPVDPNPPVVDEPYPVWDNGATIIEGLDGETITVHEQEPLPF